MALSMTNSVADVLAQQAAQAPAAAPAPTPAPAIAAAPSPTANLGTLAGQALNGYASSAQATPAPAPTSGIIAAAATPAATPAPAAPMQANPLVDPSVGLTGQPGSSSVAVLGQPKSWDVTPEQTVEGRIASIVNGSSPIIQQARTRAAEAMNGRGLLNSSLALTAADAAAYQAATPIATADAATAAKSASYNADEANQFGIKNQDAINAHAIAQLNTETQKQLTQMQNDNQRLLQSNNQAATAFNQALVSMTQINSNDRMDSNSKTQAIAQIQRDLKTQLNVLSATSGLALSQQLNFANYNGFDANGNFVGFETNGDTTGVPGSAPTYVPASTGAAPAPVGGGYGTYDPSGGGGGGA